MGVDGYVVGAAAGVEISVKERAIGAVLRQVGKAVDDAGQIAAGLEPAGEDKVASRLSTKSLLWIRCDEGGIRRRGLL